MENFPWANQIQDPPKRDRVLQKGRTGEDTGEIYEQGNHALSDSKRRPKATICAWLEWEIKPILPDNRTASDSGYDITAFDLPGHGRSTRSTTNLPEITDLISEVTKSRGPYHGIVCHSFGSVAALNAVRLGATFEKLVLISTGIYEIKPMFKTFVGLFGLDEEYYADRLFEIAESLYGASPGEFGLDRFSKQIDTETLIVHCEDDKEAMKEIALTLHSDMKNSVLHLTEGLGHRRILRDEKVAEKVMNFL